MRGSDIDEAMTHLRAAERLLRETDLTSLTSVELTALLKEREMQRRRQETSDAMLVAEIVARGVAGDSARAAPTDLLVELLRIRPGEAKARVTRAAELGPRRDLYGQPLGPILQTVAAAVSEGAISGAHADVIIKATLEIPDDLQERCGDLVETTLVDYAQNAHPGQLARAAEAIKNRLDPDGKAPPEEEEKQRRRGYGLRKNANNTSTPYGQFTPELTAMMDIIFDSLAAPQPAEDGTPDPRNADQRRHDALLETLKRLMRSDLPHTGGATVTLLLTADRHVCWIGDRPMSFPGRWRAGAAPESAGGGGGVVVKERGWVWHDRPRNEGGSGLRRTTTPPAHPNPTTTLNHHTEPPHPGPPRHRLDRRRTHRHRQPDLAVRLSPPQFRGVGLGLPDDRRGAAVDSAGVAGSGSGTAQEHRQPRRHRLRHRVTTTHAVETLGAYRPNQRGIP